MPAPNPVTTSFKSYLKTQFCMPTRPPWLYTGKDYEGNPLSVNVPYDAVKEAIRKMSLTDPMLYRMLEYAWKTNRTWDDIADAFYVDPSTVRRRVDRAIQIVFAWIQHGDLCLDNELPPVDLVMKDFYQPGETAQQIIDRYKAEKKALELEAQRPKLEAVKDIKPPSRAKKPNTNMGASR